MIELTRKDLKKIAPDAAHEYVEALIGGKLLLNEAGILASPLRLAHFLAQVMAETGGLKIVRESLYYTSVTAVRRAWRARASKHTDAWIAANLLRNPIKLGDWAYGGRMGNRKGTEDGFAYRGGGFMQTTGKWAVQQYAKKLGLQPSPALLEDHAITLQFAVLEWREGECNEYADRNDVLSISRIINVGKANTTVMPNGMKTRERYLKTCLEVLGDKELASEIEPEIKLPKVEEPQPVAEAVKDSRTIFGVLVAAFASLAQMAQDGISVALDAGTRLDALEPVRGVFQGLGVNMGSALFALTIAALALALYARLDDARKGRVVK